MLFTPAVAEPSTPAFAVEDPEAWPGVLPPAAPRNSGGGGGTKSPVPQPLEPRAISAAASPTHTLEFENRNHIGMKISLEARGQWLLASSKWLVN